MKFRTIVLIAIGFGLYSCSHSLELRGDLAPIAASGVSAERAQYHILALVVLIAGLGCFVAAGLGIVRGLRDRF